MVSTAFQLTTEKRAGKTALWPHRAVFLACVGRENVRKRTSLKEVRTRTEAVLKTGARKMKKEGGFLERKAFWRLRELINVIWILLNIERGNCKEW